MSNLISNINRGFLQFVYDFNQPTYRWLERTRYYLRSLYESEKAQHYRQRQTAEYLLISLPNCGRTWLKIMIGKAMQLAYHLDDIQKITDLYSFSTFNPHLPSIKVIHEKYGQYGSYENHKIILLVRHPADAVISRYFGHKTRNPDLDLSQFIWETSFLDDQITFYNLWRKNSHLAKDFLLITYENLRADTFKELRRIFDFLNLDIQDRILEDAIQYASFENMRKIEIEGGEGFKIARGKNRDYNNPETFKVRKGKVSGYKEYLNLAEVEAIETKIRDNLDPFYDYSRSIE